MSTHWLAGTAFTFAAFMFVFGGARAAPASSEDYARSPEIRTIRLSPSGNRLASLVMLPNGQTQLNVVDLPRKAAPRTVAGFTDVEISRFAWVNDDRLIYDVVDASHGVAVRQDRAATFAVNHDGENVRELIAYRVDNKSTGTKLVERTLNYQWRWIAPIDDGSNDVWAEERLYDARGVRTGSHIARLDTTTISVRKTATGAPDYVHWITQQGKGPFVIQSQRKGRSKVYWRAPGKEDWALVQDVDTFHGDPMNPLVLETDGTLLVSSRAGKDFRALYSFDPATQKLAADAVLAVRGFDLSPSIELDSKTWRTMGVHFMTDKPQTVWFDQTYARIQRDVDATLPKGRVNHLDCARCESTRFVKVFSESDRQPGEFLVFDRTEKKLISAGKMRPWIDEAAQGTRSFHRVAARDGLSLPVYVTHPPGAQPDTPLPAVMLVHGGPFMRGVDLTWSEEAQFLASRGYLVLEPEFRGSIGYGLELADAGIRQHGRGMQDDLTDALKWAVKERLVDDKRVCIMGSSYGGYAALMGPIKDPGVYRCAISFAGLTDIELLTTAWGSDMTDEVRNYYMPYTTGVPGADSEQLRQVSPLHRVQEIKVPVLLAHGFHDRRVPLEHANAFVAAARKAGVDLTDVVYEEEGHGFSLDKNRADYYRRVEAFLAKHIGPGAAR